MNRDDLDETALKAAYLEYCRYYGMTHVRDGKWQTQDMPSVVDMIAVQQVIKAYLMTAASVQPSTSASRVSGGDAVRLGVSGMSEAQQSPTTIIN